MSKFDAVFEKIWISLNEETKYVESILEDYVRLLMSALKSQEYFDDSLEDEIKRVMSQKGGVKIFGIAKEGLPPLKIEMSSPGKDKFNVTVINAMDEEDQKSFESDLSTNCIQDVMAYIKQKRIEGLGSNNAVEEMPPSQGGEAQLGAGGSALPGIASAPGVPAV
jgi:hypothetical protein